MFLSREQFSILRHPSWSDLEIYCVKFLELKSQDLIWKIKSTYIWLVTLVVQCEHKNYQSSLSPFVFVCDGPVNLLTFKPHGLDCSRYSTKHEACASDHTWIWHACFLSFWMIKAFTFYLNGELTGYQWFPQDIGSVQESGCIMLCEVSGSGP